MTTEEQSIEKVKLFAGTEYWAHVITALDREIESICKGGGYGKVEATFTIQNGGIAVTQFRREFHVKALPGQPTPSLNKK